MVKVYEWKCPKCGKIINSIYNQQFLHNKEQHINSHHQNPMERKKPLSVKKLKGVYEK